MPLKVGGGIIIRLCRRCVFRYTLCALALYNVIFALTFFKGTFSPEQRKRIQSYLA